MDFLRQFSALVGEVYETALTRSDWSSYANNAAKVFDARMAGVTTALLSSARRIPEGSVYRFADIPYEPEYDGPHFMIEHAWRSPRGTLNIWQRLSRSRDLNRTDYVAAAKLKFGIEHTALILTQPVDDLTNMLFLIRHLSQEPFSREHLESLGVLSSHFHRAMRLARQRSDVAVANPLDRFQCAAFLVDQNGKILLENELGVALLRSDDRLARDGRMRIGDELDTSLSKIAADRFGPAPSFFDVERNGASGTLAAMVSPTPAAIAGQGPQGATALVLLSDPNRFVCPPAWSLQQEYGLTSAEARFVISFAKSKGIKEAARHLGIGWETGRRHLKSVFEKTHTHSQVELTHLLLKHPASILGEMSAQN